MISEQDAATPTGENPDYNPEAVIARLREHLAVDHAALEPFARVFRWTNLPAADDEAQVFWRKHWLTGERMKLTTEHFRLAALAFYHDGILPTDIRHSEEEMAEAMAEEMMRYKRVQAMQAALDEFEREEMSETCVEGQDPNDDGLLCPNCGHHRTWPPTLLCLIAAPGFHRQPITVLLPAEQKNPLSPESIRHCATSFGVVVWRSWRNNMLKQARQVAENRMRWDTLPQQDKELDCQIYADVASHFVAWLSGQLEPDDNAEDTQP